MFDRPLCIKSFIMLISLHSSILFSTPETSLTMCCSLVKRNISRRVALSIEENKHVYLRHLAFLSRYAGYSLHHPLFDNMCIQLACHLWVWTLIKSHVTIMFPISNRMIYSTPAMSSSWTIQYKSCTSWEAHLMLCDRSIPHYYPMWWPCMQKICVM